MDLGPFFIVATLLGSAVALLFLNIDAMNNPEKYKYFKGGSIDLDSIGCDCEDDDSTDEMLGLSLGVMNDNDDDD